MKAQILAVTDEAISQLCQRLQLRLPASFSYQIEVPKTKKFGDFSVNAAFKLADVCQKSPREAADLLRNQLQEVIQAHPSLKHTVQKIEVAGAGYINFFVKEGALAAVLATIKKQDARFGQSHAGKKTRVLVEFVSANPTGPLTIAHGRQACVGDALIRILKAAGYDAVAEYYLNDRGRQMDLLGESVWVRYMELVGPPSRPLPTEGYQGEYIREIAKEIYTEKKASFANEPEEKVCALFSQIAAQKIMEGIQKDLKDIDVSFDSYFSERSLFEAKQVEGGLKLLQEKGVLYERDGALWFRSTDFGDDKDRVLRKSMGDYTYLAPDIAYHKNKFDRGFALVINLWGPDHHGYVPRLRAAIQALGCNPDQLKVIIVQLATLYREGKPFRMSTRKGEFITLRELVDEVGADATRFFFMMRRTDSHLDFDLELAKQKSQDNPVYYLQYAHARICSIMKFAKRDVSHEVDATILKTPEEEDLLKLLAQYPEVVNLAASALEPYRVADYLRELAGAFHRFYTFHRVVSPDEHMTQARLLLVDSVRIVLRNGLQLLGISHPETM